jgi:hypothetical protein
MFAERSKSLMLPAGGIHDVDRYRNNFVFDSPNNTVQAQSAAARACQGPFHGEGNEKTYFAKEK